VRTLPLVPGRMPNVRAQPMVFGSRCLLLNGIATQVIIESGIKSPQGMVPRLGDASRTGKLPA
jgi:hypothetical protein